MDKHNWRTIYTSRLNRLFLLAVIVLCSACSSLPPGSSYPKTVSTALAHPETTRLGGQFQQAAHEHGDLSGFRMIPVGADGFLIRMQMINAAERTLDLQYFIFHGDKTGKLLTDAVLRAADRGVHIRILVDDGETKGGDEQIATLAAHPSIEVRVFNPFAYRGHVLLIRGIEYLLNASRLDYRMHNKLMVVDNAIALIGGRNIGDEYFQIDPDSQFADDDIFAAGPISQEMSSTFDEFWNNALSIPIQALDTSGASYAALIDNRNHLDVERDTLKAEVDEYSARVSGGQPFAGLLSGSLPLVWAHAQVICDSPDKKSIENGDMVGKLMHRVVANEANQVHSELLMITPYLVPGKDGMQLLDGLRQRHINVRILTSSLEATTVLLAQSGYMRYRMPMLEDGIELYEIRSRLGNVKGSGQTKAISRFGNYSLHGKMFVFDRQKVFIGSMNFDQRSMHLNTEIGLIIDSPALAQQVATRFAAMVQPENTYIPFLRYDHAGAEPDLMWRTQENGEPMEYDTEPARSFLQRGAAHALSWLPLDKEL